ncbi:MAG: T9SS type A sorting domain-containing protein [Bacteroidetes bacterium]|nr:T9SS type A sorting domain-containing protein [Bacteroidota bacterium]
MKKFLVMMVLVIGLGFSAQSQSAEMRIENQEIVNSTTFEFDVYIYNTSGSTWELKAGTVSINFNPTFTGGTSPTLTFSIPDATTSGLSAANQAGAISFNKTGVWGTNYCRKVIGSAGTGLGTSIVAGGRVRVARFRLVTSGTWGNAAPDMTWHINATPYAGCSYDNAGVATILISNTVNPSNAKNPVYRDGTGWRKGSVSGSTVSLGTAAPTTGDDVVLLGSASVTGSVDCRNLQLHSGASYTVGAGNKLTVKGSITNNGTLTGSGADLEISGATTTSNQSIGGSGSLSFRDVVMGAAGVTGTKTLGVGLTVNRNLQLQGPTTLASAGNLVLASNALGTARLLELPAGASVTGNVTVERFVPGSSGRKYRYLAAPFATGPTLAASWQQQIHITGPGTGGSLCPSPSPNSNGFDATQTNAPSMFTFNETTAVNTNTAGNNGGTVYNNAWVTVPNTNSTTLQAGKGYKVFVRGNKSQGCDLVNGANPSPNDVTLSGTGVLAQGTFNFGVTYSSNNGEGWNLLGNPYPCAIDWNAAGWTKTNLDNTIWVFRPAGNQFATYNVLSGGVNFGSNIIESGGAFFVHATASSPVLTANESVKIGNSPSTPLFKSQLKKLSLTFVKVGEVQDEILVGMAAEATDANDAFDAEKMSNPALNVYARSSDGKQQAINIFKAAQPETRVPLGINTTFTGEHRFSFKGETEFNAYDVLLEDRYAGIIQMVNDRPNYTFEINSDPASYGEGRFSLLFVDRGDFDYLKRVKSIYSSVTASLNAYPNPSKGLVQLQTSNLQGKSAEVKVYNAVGAEIQRMEQAIDKGICSFSLDLSDQASGVYFVEVSDNQGNTRKAKVVKSNN